MVQYLLAAGLMIQAKGMVLYLLATGLKIRYHIFCHSIGYG